MQLPFQISYRHVDPSESLNARAREKAEELERFYRPIIGCHVLIERPGHHHKKGKGAHFRVRIDLSVPGEALVVGRDPARTTAHEDPFLALNEAFHAMRRQLQDYVRRRRGYVKARVGPAHGRVVRLFPDRGLGFIRTADGREIYFQASSVLGGFDRLELDSEVRFAEELGDEGPQASTVEPVGKEGHHELAAAEGAPA